MNTAMLIVLSIAAIAALSGFIAWGVQIAKGMKVTNLGNLHPWGSYIAGFVFFLGLSAGALILAGIPLLMDNEVLSPYVLLTLFVALAALIVAILFITADLGRPLRMWRIIFNPNPRSPMFWDVALVTAYFLIILTLILAVLTGVSLPILRVLGFVAILAGALDGVSALVFSTRISRPLWFSAVQPVAFVTAALASAAALVSGLIVVLDQPTAPETMTNVVPLCLTAAVCLVLGQLFMATEQENLRRSGNAFAQETAAATRSSIMQTIETVMALAAALLFLVATWTLSPPILFFAAGLALVALYMKRLHFVGAGQEVAARLGGGVNLEVGREKKLRKHPVEMSINIGFIGTFALITTVLIELFETVTI